MEWTSAVNDLVQTATALSSLGISGAIFFADRRRKKRKKQISQKPKTMEHQTQRTDSETE